MRFFAACIGFALAVSLCDGAAVERRAYRNTEEILVPVTIIRDGEEIKEPVDLTETANVSQNKNLRTGVTANEIAAAVEEEQKLEAVEAAAVQAQRRIDEAIVEEEIKEAIQEEQVKEAITALEERDKAKATLAAEPQLVTVVQTATGDELAHEIKQGEIVVVDAQTPKQAIGLLEASNDAEQPQVHVRQATQATPLETSTQQNFVQQLIQNSPLGQFFNQISGQTTQVASDETLPAPVPTLPGFFNPVTAVQTAAQSVVNSTTQAFQGLQQFASNLGNQFQNTLSNLGGQQQDPTAADVTTARPPGPIQQLVNTFIGTPQPSPTQQGPLQGLLNIFQGTNRPQAAAASVNIEPQPAKEPEIQAATSAEATDNTQLSNDEQINNELRDSGESSDSFEDTVQPDEFIVVNDDATQTENEQFREVAEVPK